MTEVSQNLTVEETQAQLIEDLRAALKDSQTNLMTLTQTVNTLHAQKSLLESNVTVLQAQRTEGMERETNARVNLETVKVQLKGSDAQIKELSDQNGRLIEAHKELNVAYVSRDKAYTELHKTFAAQQEKVSKLRKQITDNQELEENLAVAVDAALRKVTGAPRRDVNTALTFAELREETLEEMASNDG